MLIAGVIMLMASVVAYVVLTAYMAGEYRKLGWDRRTGDWPPPDDQIPHIPRAIALTHMASYPGALIGAALIVLGLI